MYMFKPLCHSSCYLLAKYCVVLSNGCCVQGSGKTQLSGEVIHTIYVPLKSSINPKAMSCNYVTLTMKMPILSITFYRRVLRLLSWIYKMSQVFVPNLGFLSQPIFLWSQTRNWARYAYFKHHILQKNP